MLDDFAGRRVTVMGLGRFGGGAGVARWLAGQGAAVLVTDLAGPDSLADSIADIQDLIDRGTISLRLGGHHAADFSGADLVVANPAVPQPWRDPYLTAAASAGVPITTEIRLLIERLNRDRVIGVTGTAGKSTTAAMIEHLLRRAGRRAHLGGNIGGSLLSEINAAGDEDWFVLELSSAMLHWLGAGAGRADAPGWSPHIAVYTNLEPNHLDWHGSFEHYRGSKQNIQLHQTPADHLITGADRPTDTPRISLRVPGKHNEENAAMAIAATAGAIGLDEQRAATELADFTGLPHRLQLVAERDGCRYYDDSKSTTPRATALAIRAFSEPARVHLIAGGYDKQVNLASIAEAAPLLAGLYTIGATGRALADAAASGAHGECCSTLPVAVERAMSRMRTGDVLLLSPGCASWDQFDNYEQRGEVFASLVRAALAAPHAHVDV